MPQGQKTQDIAGFFHYQAIEKTLSHLRFSLSQEKKCVYIPALSIAPLIAMEPSLVAGSDERDPWKDPIGVLTALAITTS